MADTTMKKMGADEFARALVVDAEHDDHRFAFFLGAGCSRSSGILTAGELVANKWLPKLCHVKCGRDTDVTTWAKKNIEGYDENNPAASYGPVIEQLFHKQSLRQNEIESICDGAEPGFGYAAMARLCSLPNPPANAILTTNFDDLMADAMFLYSEERPLVIHHASLAEFIRPTRTRPMIVKLHGDARLSPQNTVLETTGIQNAMRQKLKMLLHDIGMVFMGYSGADKSVVTLLEGLDAEALPLGVYWVNRSLPGEQLLNWLESRDAVWVEHTDFDEVMLRLFNEFDATHPSEDRFGRMFTEYMAGYKRLSDAVQTRDDSGSETATLKDAVRTTSKKLPDKWATLMHLLSLHDTEPDTAAEQYEEAIQHHPGFAPLLGSYANFLDGIRGDHDAAEEYFRRAIDAAPQDSDYLGNYAVFLTNNRRDHDAAEEHYKRALNADPKNGKLLGNYAEFLLSTGRQKAGFEMLDLSDESIKESAVPRNSILLTNDLCRVMYGEGERKKNALDRLKHKIQSHSARNNGWIHPEHQKRLDALPLAERAFMHALIAVVTGKEEANTLDAFDEWEQIPSHTADE